MAKTQLPIANGFYVSESLPVSGQQCINMYPNIPQNDTVTDANLFTVPGLVELLNLSTIDFCRGSDVLASIPYVIVGNSLFRIDRTVDALGVESFASVNLGTIDGTGLVSVANNGEQLAITVPGGKSYVYDVPTTTLAEIVDVSFDGPADTVKFIDGYFNFTTSDGKKFFNSPLNDGRGLPSGTAYDALDFSTAEADPDQIRGQASFKNQLFILGSETTEVYQNIGRTPAPFDRISGFILQKGLRARFSIVESQDTFAFIGGGVNESPAVWAFNGNNYNKISTIAIDNLFRKLTAEELDQISAWSYGENGNYFVGFNLPTTTIVYDFTTSRWHERQSFVDGALTRYRVNGMLTAYGRVMVCDAIDGKIGELDKDIQIEYDQLIRTVITTKPFDNLGQAVFLYSLEAVIESGVGNSTENAPVIRLSWSDDGGRTFGSELQRPLGRVGQYFTRAIWRRLGRFDRSRVLRFEMSDPVKRVFIKLEADFA